MTRLSTMEVHKTHGLPLSLQLKIGIRIMITNNINVEDGLVSGACGVLEHVYYENGKPNVLFIKFYSNCVGHKARTQLSESYIPTNGDIDEWVPIVKVPKDITIAAERQFQVSPTQFPLMLAEA